MLNTLIVHMMFLLHSSSSGTLKFSVLALLFYGGCKATVAENATFPALIVFGDSIVDSGNNNYLSTIVKCDFLPYGRDFQKGKPTGRFCDGKVPSNFSVEFYGIKELLPPYLDPNLQLQDLLTGVSFASGGAGYDPLTAKIVELYGLGARRVLVVGLPPIGCVPSQRTLGGGLNRGCANKSNHAAWLYNSKLSAQMDSLKKSFPGFKIVYADVYNPLLSIIQNPKQYGLEEVNKGYCGTGNIEVSILCNHLSDEQNRHRCIKIRVLGQLPSLGEGLQDPYHYDP